MADYLKPLIVAILAAILSACSVPGENDFITVFQYPPSPVIPTLALTAPSDLVTPEPAPYPTMESTSTQPPAPMVRLQDVAISTPKPTATVTPPPTATPCQSPGQIISGYFDSPLAGTRPYRIYLPPCYEQGGQTYPTLYMLPGNIHTESVWDDLGLDEAAEQHIMAGDLPPMLIVMASGGSLADYTSGGPGSYESVVMDDLIPYIEDHYCAWRERAGRAIGGMSRGGYWALEIAFRNPDQFASVGGHSAALFDWYGGQDINPQFTGSSNDLLDLRIYFDVGENDWVISNIRQLHEEMAAVGREHTWVVNEGYHENTYWAAHVDEYISWYGGSWSLDRRSYPACDLESGS